MFGQEIKFVICAGGIFFFYLCYGILQENVYVRTYGPNNEKFRYSLFAVFVQCVLAAAISFIAIQLLDSNSSNNNNNNNRTVNEGKQTEKTKRNEHTNDHILNNKNQHTQREYSAFAYFCPAATQTLALFCSNYALQYVDYPTQVLAKSCKPIPIMLTSILIFRQRQSLQKILFVLMITGGISLFMLQEGRNIKKAQTESEVSLSLWTRGMIFIVSSLFFDGLTGSLQDHLIAKYKPSSYRLMFISNLWAILLTAVGLVLTGEGSRVVQFGVQYPNVLLDIFLFSLVGALGQNFIYYTIYNFGALVCSIITTTRKFFTILFSVLFYGHTLTSWQWIAVVMVFVGLILDMLFSKNKQHHTKEKKM